MRRSIFTFGIGQPLAGYYVAITAPEPRDVMHEQFGQNWSREYRTEEEAGVYRHGLECLIELAYDKDGQRAPIESAAAR